MKDWWSSNLGIATIVVPIATMILIFDLSIPLGVAGGVPYVILVLMGIWLPRRRHIIYMAILGTALTLFGYLASPEGGTPWVVITNRLLAFFIIWVTAFLVLSRSQFEYNLLKAKEQAEAGKEAKSRFLSSMSHELRTPMNAVLGFAQILDQDTAAPLSKTQKTYVDEILQSGHHMMGLIGNVLDLERIESSAVSMNMTGQNPGPLIDGCLNMVAADAEKSGIVLHNQTDANDLPEISVDPLHFKQALLNLLSNAIKYNESGGEVVLKCDPGRDGVLHISVSDTGPGIAEDMQDKVFEPFERLGAETSNIPGVGIGLNVTKRLIEAMDGAVGFESALGEGSTFWIDMPVAELEAQPTT